MRKKESTKILPCHLPLPMDGTKQYNGSILKTAYYNAAFVYRRRAKGKGKCSMYDNRDTDCVLTLANVSIAGVRVEPEVNP